MRCRLEDLTIRENDSFGNFLRKKRLKLGLNQDDFAYFLGVKQQTICKWETGRTSPPINDALNYIKFLGGDMKILNKDDYKPVPVEGKISSKDRLSELEDRYPRTLVV